MVSVSSIIDYYTDLFSLTNLVQFFLDSFCAAVPFDCCLCLPTATRSSHFAPLVLYVSLMFNS